MKHTTERMPLVDVALQMTGKGWAVIPWHDTAAGYCSCDARRFTLYTSLALRMENLERFLAKVLRFVSGRDTVLGVASDSVTNKANSGATRF